MSASSGSVIFRRTLAWFGLVTLLLGAIGALAGYLYAGGPGLLSALVGVGLAAVFLGLTAVTMLVGQRFQQPDSIAVFFGIIIGGWLLKIIIFVIILFVLLGQDWLHGGVFFFAVLASVISSLTIDMVVMAKSRVPYVGDIALPGDDEN